MARVFNFNPGPAVLPLWALETAQKELLDYKGTGMSIIESSHRAKEFEAVIAEAEALFRELWKVPENFKVLFCHGGASTQFFMVPMNLAGNDPVDYVVTGQFAEKALEEANIQNKKTNIAYNSKSTNHDRIPAQSELKLTPNAAYVHITTNNTIYGTEWKTLPETNGVPIVADMSSDILAYHIDWKNMGLVYAGVQKNLGPSGCAIVVIREDLLKRVPENLPTMLKYTTYSKDKSLYNTPSTFTIYMVGLVLQWLKKEGGVEAIEKRNQKKAGLIYQAIDESNGFYKGHAQKDSRSIMNITFTLAKKDLEEVFVKEAKAAGLVGLKGHRSVGGMRASIYNAMPEEGCAKLAQFMKDFQKKNS